ncbi:MAG: ABC transporter permease [Syntrophobacteraceae bacterium]
MNFLKLTLGNILRYKTRSFLSVLAIASSVAVFFSIISLSKGFDREIAGERERTGVDFVVAPSSCPHELASLLFYGAVPVSFLDESLAVEIRKTKGLAFAASMIVINVPSDKKEDRILIYGYQMPLLERLKPGWRIKGEIPVGYDAIAANKVLVGADFAEKYGYKIGDVIQLPKAEKSLPISGIVERTYTKDDAFIFAPLAVAQEIALRVSGKEVAGVEDITCSPRDKITPDPISAVAVKVDDPAMITEITSELGKKIPGIQIVTVSQATDSISHLVASVNALGLSVAIIAFVVAAAGVMNSILLTTFELTSELGMMRAVGASRSDIFSLVLLRALMLAGVGGVAGVALALSGASAIEWIMRKIFTFMPGPHLIAFDPAAALLCIAVSIALGACAGLFPAWMASRVNPIEAIRND